MESSKGFETASTNFDIEQMEGELKKKNGEWFQLSCALILGPRASNSIEFAPWRGPFASPGWVRQKVHSCRSKELSNALIVSS
jgi:hypothetical protein